ncbi:MAG: O-antigen ligase [Sphingobacteriales bacterium]|jgi:O-antigen ligase
MNTFLGQSQKLFFVAMIIIAAFMPFWNLGVNIGVGMLAAAWLISADFRSKIKTFKARPLFWLLPILFLICLLGLLYSSNQTEAFKDLGVKLPLLLVPLIFGSSKVVSRAQLGVIMKVFIGACLVACFYCLFMAGYYNVQEGYTLSYFLGRIFGDTPMLGEYAYFNYEHFTYHYFSTPLKFQPIYFSLFLTLAAYFSIWLAWENKRVGNSEFTKRGIILFVFFFVIIMLLSSRSQSMVFIFTSVLWAIVWAIKNKKLILGLSVGGMVVLFGMMMIMFNPINKSRFTEMVDMENTYEETEWMGRSLRLQKWLYALELIKENPVIGVGVGDAPDELMRIYAKNDFHIGLKKKFNSHNEYLQFAIHSGVLGLLFLLFSLAYPAWVGLKSQKNLFLAFVILFSLSLITEAMFERTKGLMFFTFFYSILAGFFIYPETEESLNQ